MRFPRFVQHSTTALLFGGLMGTTLTEEVQPNIAVQTLIPQVDPTNTNVVTGIGVSYPAASTKHKSSGSSINSKEGCETEVPSLYVTTTAITFVDLVLPESENDDEDDRGSNTEMPTEMPTWTVFFLQQYWTLLFEGLLFELLDPAARR